MPRFSQPPKLEMFGWYNAFITKCEWGQNKKGADVVHVQFTITTSEGTVIVKPKFGAIYNPGVMKKIWEACGKEYDEEKPEELVGLRIDVLLEVDGEWGSQVTDYKRSQDGPVAVSKEEVPF